MCSTDPSEDQQLRTAGPSVSGQQITSEPTEPGQEVEPYTPNILLQGELHLLQYDQAQWTSFLQKKKKEGNSNQQMMVLTRYHTSIINTKNVGFVLDHLIQDETITDEDEQNIRHEKSTQAQMRALLGIIRRRGQAAFFSFACALVKSGELCYQKLYKECVLYYCIPG